MQMDKYNVILKIVTSFILVIIVLLSHSDLLWNFRQIYLLFMNLYSAKMILQLYMHWQLRDLLRISSSSSPDEPEWNLLRIIF